MMPHTHKLLFFAGSAREGSFNKKLAQLAVHIAEANGIAATFADLGDYPMPLFNRDLEASEGIPENARKLRALMQVHGGIFIAAPEYNASVTPLLKNTLDWVSRVRDEGEPPLQVFKTRVFAIASASPGRFGGVRGLITLRQVLAVGLGALVLPEQVSVPHAEGAFDEKGHLKDKPRQELVKTVVGKLARAAKVLHGEG
ncbi:MAG: NAD(P)H-dependent oxidoreductase [Hyphomicrobiaceae bacterium]|nr:NAD(P)H-dependent oxidoreductase [Hyphomicrobiaceae bacterium]